MLKIELDVLRDDVKVNAFDREPKYDPKYEDVNSLLGDICELLAKDKVFKFRVNGFGDSCWPLDIRTDLCTFLEQLPSAIKALDKDSGEFDIDFYEQGLERRLVFTIKGGNVLIECMSATTWIPHPFKITHKKLELKSMLVDIYNKFKEVSMKTYPGLTSHNWFAEY